MMFHDAPEPPEMRLFAVRIDWHPEDDEFPFCNYGYGIIEAESYQEACSKAAALQGEGTRNGVILSASIEGVILPEFAPLHERD